MFALFLSSITVAMAGMLYIIYRKYKTHKSTLLTAFSRDGAGYFLCLSATANLIISFVSQPSNKYILAQPEAILHAILSTRLVLHLRSIAEHERQWGVALQRSGGIGGIKLEDSESGRGYAAAASWWTISALEFA
ncbi:hypothetical protein MD484_g7529, partial [Candolleomyces efflorescens]